LKNLPNKKPAYVPDRWETVNCPFCDANKPGVYERFGSELQYTYVKCANCGLIYCNPRPAYNQHFIDSAYASYYQYADNMTVDDLNSINESSVKMFNKEIDHLVKYDKARTGVLDIGSGMGTFLLAAKKYYPNNIEGLDVSQKMADFVKRNIGVNVRIQQFENFFPEVKYSLIHMSHVLEHVPNPNQWIAHARELLESGGILVINVPNKLAIGNRFQHFFYKVGIKRQFANDWNEPSRTPDHLFEPTIKSMKYLLGKHGFEILEHYTYSRRDPVSNSSLWSRLVNRGLKQGTNLAFITRPA
jgi:2-polyprenyl-3-methyl-5-hydroxy-6-metoxy-1,4-benzoquinol methylase